MRSLVLLVAVTAVAHAEPPQVVTQAWLRQQARTSFPILDNVDPDRGLVVIEHVTDVADPSVPETQTAKLVCGDALKKALPALKKSLKAEHKRSDVIGCRNQKDGLAWCKFQFAFEWSISSTVVLRKNAAGVLVPDAVLVMDAGSMNDAAYKKMHQWVAQSWAKTRSTDCTGKAVEPPSVFPDDFLR